MHKILIILGIATVLFSACNNKKNSKPTEVSSDIIDFAVDFDELNDKYDTMDFKSCDEAINVGNEIMEAYKLTCEGAKKNIAKAKSDLIKYDDLINKFDSACAKFTTRCPEDFDKWEKENRQKIYQYSALATEIAADKEAIPEWDDTISGNLQIQVDELKDEIKRLTSEE